MNKKAFISNPARYLFVSLSDRHMLNGMPDRLYLSLYYRLTFGKKLNLSSPQTFNEKLQWLKLYDRNPLYTDMVDKYEAKKYAANIIGDNCIIPTLGVWDKFEQIDFNSLPMQFVLKCTHDSGGLIICRNKLDLNIEFAREKMKKSLSNNFFFSGREWPYKNVKPRIIAETYMQDGDSKNLTVYKIFNFNGEPKILQVIQNDKTSLETIDYFDTTWNRLNLRQNYPNSAEPVNKPQKLDEMLNLAKMLSKNHAFLRTDFYIINNDIYFSEFTFYSDCGFKKFDPPEWDQKLGDWIDLSTVNTSL